MREPLTSVREIVYFIEMIRSSFHGCRAIAAVAVFSASLASCAGMGSRFDPSSLPPGLRSVIVNGVPVVYKDEGRGEPVLILTPYPFSTDLWTPLVQQLTPSSRVIVVEPAGLRHSQAMQGDFTTEHFLQIYRQFILNIGLDKVHVVGVGESGALAVAFGHHFPQHTLTSVSINGFESVTWTKKIGDIIGLFDATTVSNLSALLSKSSVRHRIRPPHAQEISRLVVIPPADQEDPKADNPVHARFRAYSTDIKGGYIAAMLPSVDRPLLLIRSEGDEVLPERYVERTQEQIRRVKVREEVIPGAGHFAFLDQPDKVAQAILTFHSLYPLNPNNPAS